MEKTAVDHYRALAVAQHECPQCKAPPGYPCIGKRGKERKASHGPRFDLAIGRPPRDHTVDRRLPQPTHPKAAQ